MRGGLAGLTDPLFETPGSGHACVYMVSFRLKPERGRARDTLYLHNRISAPVSDDGGPCDLLET